MNDKVSMPIGHPKIYIHNIQTKAGKQLSKKVIEETDKIVKEIKQHFKKDKYSLDLSLLESELVAKVFGDVGWYFVSRIVHAGFNVGTKPVKNYSSFLISKR